MLITSLLYLHCTILGVSLELEKPYKEPLRKGYSKPFETNLPETVVELHPPIKISGKNWHLQSTLEGGGRTVSEIAQSRAQKQ